VLSASRRRGASPSAAPTSATEIFSRPHACRSYTFHVGEVILSSVLRLPLLALLGVQLEQLALYEVMLFAVVQFHHANIGLPEWLDRALRWIIVTPHLHKVHHSVIRVEADLNFSALFSWWDRVFRTFRLSPQPRQIVFGVDNER